MGRTVSSMVWVMDGVELGLMRRMRMGFGGAWVPREMVGRMVEGECGRGCSGGFVFEGISMGISWGSRAMVMGFVIRI